MHSAATLLLRRTHLVAIATLAAACGPRTAGTASDTVSAVARERFSGHPAIRVLSATGGFLRGDSLELRSTLTTTASTLVIHVVARNVSHGPLWVNWGSCSLNPRLYTSASRTGPPVFDWERRPNPDPAIGRWACPTYLRTATLAPGESLDPQEFVLALPAASIAGDSLQAGEYYVAAAIAISARSSSPSIGTGPRAPVAESASAAPLAVPMPSTPAGSVTLVSSGAIAIERRCAKLQPNERCSS